MDNSKSNKYNAYKLDMIQCYILDTGTDVKKKKKNVFIF